MLDFMKKHFYKLLALPISLNTLNLALTFAQYAMDGVITDEEWHQLYTLSTGSDLVFLTIAAALLKLKK